MQLGAVFDNKLAAALLPLFPVVVGGFLKFSVVDSTPKNSSEAVAFFYQNYVAGAWVEILTVSLVGVIAWGYSGNFKDKDVVREMMVVLAAPIIAAILCIILRLATPKFHLQSETLMVYLPLALSILSLAFSSIMIRELSKNDVGR